MPYFKSNKSKLYYRTIGSGPPVVLISGLAANHRSWGLQFLDLKKWFKLIAIDNRGIGKSGGGTVELSIEDMASDIDALLTMVGIEKVHLMGSSMGAMIALEYASINPERVQSLILSSLPIQKPSGTFETFVSYLTSTLQNGSRETFLQTLASYLFSSNFLRDEQFEIIADFLAKSPIDHRPETIFCQLLAIRKWLGSRKWEQGCKCPCLIVSGSEDKLVPPETIIEAAFKIFPHAIRKIIQGAGHAVHIEKSKEFNKIVCDFLRDQ